MAKAAFTLDSHRVQSQEYATLTDLPPGARMLLAATPSFFATPAWWHATTVAALPADARPAFVVVTLDDRVAGLLALVRTKEGWQALTTLYTYHYAPLLAAWLDGPSRPIVFRAFGRILAQRGLTRLDSLDPDAPDHAALLSGLRRSGLVPLTFRHFGIWEEDVAGCDWDAYLARRDGRLRETIRRRLRDIRANPAARFAIQTDTADIAAATEAYHAVEARSWKQPEPFPDFNRVLFQQAARDGDLFMATLTLDDVPIAVQAWAVRGGRATVLKLVHDEAHARLSPGTVLTALAIQHLLREPGLGWLDFGRGDDPYKRGWVGNRRQRVGLIVAAPWWPRGLAAILRHGAGRLAERWRRRAGTLPSDPPAP